MDSIGQGDGDRELNGFLERNVFLLLLMLVQLFVLIYFYFKYIRIDPRTYDMVSKVPGPKRLPIVGNAFEFAVPSHEIISNFDRLLQEYDRNLFGGWLANRPYFFMGTAESAEKLLSSHVPIQKAFDYKFLGQKWKQRRKLLTPSFHFKILDDFFDVFNEQSSVLINILKDKYDQQDNVVDIFPIITRCALDIICETAMGEKVNAQRNSDSAYVKAIYKNSELFVQRVSRPWLRNDLIWKVSMKEWAEKKAVKILHDFTEQVIRQRKQERKEKMVKGHSQITVCEDVANSAPSTVDVYVARKRRLAFLDLLLDASCDGKVLTDLDIREETDTFMFEGHDTSAASMSWTVFLLACNPECQVKVREEVNEVFTQIEGGKLIHGDISKLRYLECCVKEALRLYPSVPFIARHINQDFDIDNGIILPGGSEVFITPFFIHRDPKYYPNPNEFRPERFFYENCKDRNPYAYIPFSAGPRNCIGQKFALMEEKVVLANLFQNFWFEPMENIEEIKLVPDIILRPVDGLHVKFTLAGK